MAINLSLPEGPETPHLKPKITVVGVGGAGGNAVNNMIDARLEGVDFVVANTDAQALCHSKTQRRIQLGTEATQGLGAGARPEVGRVAAEECVEGIAQELQGANMVFITAGMGGGTGTGAAPVVASVARELGILTVGVVTKPFQFEGAHRMRLAESGIDELAGYVDTLIIIPNQNLFRVANEKTTFADAFKLADDVLYSGVRSVTDLMINPGLINLDFADVRTVMQNMGRAMMGTGEADGERRALEAAEAAIANPLLEDTSMRGARGVLINITGGSDVTLYEVDEAANRIRDEVEVDAHIIFGSSLDEELAGRIRVSVVATGLNEEAMRSATTQDSRQTRAVAQERVPEVKTRPSEPPAQRSAAAAQPVMRAAPAQSAPAQTAPAQAAPSQAAPSHTAQAPAHRAQQQAPAQAQPRQEAPRAHQQPQQARPAAPAQQAAPQQPARQPAPQQPAPAPRAEPRSSKAQQAVRLLESLVLEANAKQQGGEDQAQAAQSRPLQRPPMPQRPSATAAPQEPAPVRRPAQPTPMPQRSAPRVPRDAFIPSPAIDTGNTATARDLSLDAWSQDRVQPVQGSLNIPDPVADAQYDQAYDQGYDQADMMVDDQGYTDMAAQDHADDQAWRPEVHESVRDQLRAERQSAAQDPAAPRRAEKPSLLARITGLAGSRSHSADRPDGNPLLSAKTLSAEADPSEADQNSDELEIPAFLRRQAN